MTAFAGPSRIDIRQVEKDGQKRTYTDIVARDVQFLSGGKGQQSAQPSADNDGFGAAPTLADDFDSMPF